MTKASLFHPATRPHLVKVAPLIFYIMVGFMAFNLVIGYSLYTLHPMVPLIILIPAISLDMWATVFAANGIVMLLGLIANHWGLLRWSMSFGFVIKLLWLFGLFIRIHAGGTLFLSAMWLLITFIQGATIIFFPPGDHGVRQST